MKSAKLKILIVDNYDSFTYNLYQIVGELLEEAGGLVEVVRNNEITLKEIKRGQFDRIVLSPGPGTPADRKYFGVCADILQQVRTIPILGVCLGMQGIAHYFGGSIIPARQMMHGKTSIISHDGKGIFTGVAQEISVMRYHSLVADPQSLPECLEITAIVPDVRGPCLPAGKAAAHHPTRVTPSREGLEIMGLRHKTLPIEGVQFHPESFATEEGKRMLSNFLFGGRA